MATLEQTLERFNRKERNLLVRDILGNNDGIPPPLHQTFCNKLSEVIGLKVCATAWWATDYHINWLAGALGVYIQGDKSFVNHPTDNVPVTTEQDDSDSAVTRRLVEGNQEDIDLLIAFDHNLIMIEAKAYGPFTVKQIRSKLSRLTLLHAFYETLNPTEAQKITFFLVLEGPKDPETLLKDIEMPCWLHTRWRWIELQLKQPLKILEVTRCDDNGQSSATGQKWKVFESPYNTKPNPARPGTAKPHTT